MGFKIIAKSGTIGGGNAPQRNLYIGKRWSRLPKQVRESVGGMVNVLVDEERGLVAFRNADDDDRNAYLVTANNVVGCRSISSLARTLGSEPPITVPIAYDAELDAWVADLTTGEPS